MKTSRIILFGTNTLTHQVHDQLSADYPVVSYPMHYRLRAADVDGMNVLIILTLSRYDKKGLEKMAELRRIFPKVPVLIIAEKPDEEDILKAWKGGVKDLLLSPCRTQTLQKTIRSALLEGRTGTVGNRIRRFFRSIRVFLKNRILQLRKEKESRPAHLLNIATMIQPHIRPIEANSHKYDLAVQFFGNLEVVIRGKKMPKIRGKKNNSLLAYLLYHHRKPVRKDAVMAQFWPDSTEASARNSLNVAICHIRKHLSHLLPRQEIILYENDCYCINPELEISTDVDRFRTYWEKGRSIDLSQGPESALRAYNKALAVYRQDFLEKKVYEEWCESPRDNFKETYLFILNRLSAFFFERREYDACINICKKMLEKDPCLEDAHRRLMECYHYLGLDDLARNQYFKCVKVLKEDLNGAPSDQTTVFFQAIQKGKVQFADR